MEPVLESALLGENRGWGVVCVGCWNCGLGKQGNVLRPGVSGEEAKQMLDCRNI